MRIKINSLIVGMSFFLIIFHTFTFLQAYYSFIITLLAFMFILALCLIKSKGVFKIKGDPIIMLFFFVGILIVVGVLFLKENLLSMIGRYFPYILWPTLYVITDRIMDSKSKKRFILCYMAIYAISVVATLRVVMIDNDAARLLAGAASLEVRTVYYKMGVGGYGFIYGCVFVLYGLLLWVNKEKTIWLKVLLFFLLAITFVMIVFASYTTALLLAIIVLLLSFYTKTERKNATVYFVLAIIAIVWLHRPILKLIQDVASNMDLYWIENRIGQLLNADSEGSMSGLKRTGLYQMSLNSFVSNIFGGGEDIGGHSMVLDLLGRYGIWGGMFSIAFFSFLNSLRKITKGRDGLIYVAFMVLMCINTSDSIVLLPMVLFVVPHILSLVDSEEILYEKTALN